MRKDEPTWGFKEPGEWMSKLRGIREHGGKNSIRPSIARKAMRQERLRQRF